MGRPRKRRRGEVEAVAQDESGMATTTKEGESTAAHITATPSVGQDWMGDSGHGVESTFADSLLDNSNIDPMLTAHLPTPPEMSSTDCSCLSKYYLAASSPHDPYSVA